VISWFSKFAFKWVNLCRYAAVQRLPGKQETGMEILIQGNVLKELVAMLRQDWGIPSTYIEVDNKTK
jgi:hypothetical protein